jgi:hypothetical protein
MDDAAALPLKRRGVRCLLVPWAGTIRSGEHRTRLALQGIVSEHSISTGKDGVRRISAMGREAVAADQE